MNKNSLVITGCGAIGPAGVGAGPLWQAVSAGRPLWSPLVDPAFARLPVSIAGTLPAAVEPLLPWPRFRTASLMALAAEEAVRNAGWSAETLSDPATGLCAATSKGDIIGLADCCSKRPLGSGEDFLLCWPDGPGRLVADRLAIRGPRTCPVAACATGSHALIRAAVMIAEGETDRALVVVGDASITPLIIGALASMGVLTNDQCRPFDRDRSGFFISEGAAAVTLERADRAIGQPLVELAGWLTAADPTGLTTQDTTGATLAQAIRILLSKSRISPSDVTLYSAHGTATATNDLAEAAAVRAALTDGRSGPSAFAAKSIVGHMLGAASLTEVVLTIEAVTHRVCPPTPTLRNKDQRCDLAVSPKCQPCDFRAAMCASLGFGGQIGLLALRPAL